MVPLLHVDSPDGEPLLPLQPPVVSVQLSHLTTQFHFHFSIFILELNRKFIRLLGSFDWNSPFSLLSLNIIAYCLDWDFKLKGNKPKKELTSYPTDWKLSFNHYLPLVVWLLLISVSVCQLCQFLYKFSFWRFWNPSCGVCQGALLSSETPHFSSLVQQCTSWKRNYRECFTKKNSIHFSSYLEKFLSWVSITFCCMATFNKLDPMSRLEPEIFVQASQKNYLFDYFRRNSIFVTVILLTFYYSPNDL